MATAVCSEGGRAAELVTMGWDTCGCSGRQQDGCCLQVEHELVGAAVQLQASLTSCVCVAQ